MVLRRQFMHRAQESTCVLWIYFRGNAVPQVEHMTSAFAVARQDTPDFGPDSFRLGVEHGRVHVALQCNLVANAAARVTDVAGPIQAQGICPSVSDAFQPQAAVLGEQDHRHLAAFVVTNQAIKPDILVLDMGDKFGVAGNYARPDEALKACAIYARQIAKTYDCAVFYMSQLSAEAEGRTTLNQSMMEGSRTGKAAEADLMLLIGKAATVEGQDEDSPLRHVNIVKNKLNGWHGMVNCELDYLTARYSG